MELSIGQTIRNLRKQQNMTQDVLANAVGVSVAAVSKWEGGKSYPDITLLPSIARQLKTTVDNLLDFATELDPKELSRIVEQCSATFDRESLEKGYALCVDYLSQYPNDVALKLHIGAIIIIYTRSLPEKEAGEYLDKSLELCKPAASCNDPKLRLLGLRMLANIYLMSGRLDLAEERIRECMDDGEFDPTLAVIFLKKGAVEKAEEMYQRCLFRGVSNCQTALIGLSGIAGTNKNEERYLKYQNAVLSLSKLFELEKLPGFELNAYLSLVHYYAKKKLPEELLDALDGFVDCVMAWNEETDLSGNDYFWHLSTNGNVISCRNTMGDAFSQTAEELRGYEFLKGNSRFEELVGKLERYASSPSR